MSDEIMRGLLGLSQPDQARICATFFRRPCPYDEATRWARKAVAQLGPVPPGQYLSQHGIQVVESSQPASIGHVTLRARLEERRLVVYGEALSEMRHAASYFGIDTVVDVRDIMLAHEIFHDSSPQCPEPVAELGAHTFASLYMRLPYHAEVLDVAQVLYRKALRLSTVDQRL